MNIIKRILIALGLMRRPMRRLPKRTDDRLQEVLDWIAIRAERKHIVAVRNMSAIPHVQRWCESHSIECEVYSVARLCSGMMWRDGNISLSCTTTLDSELQYVQLLHRLRGLDPEYNVVLNPEIKVRERTTSRRGLP